MATNDEGTLANPEGADLPGIEAVLLPTIFAGHHVGLVAADLDGVVTAVTAGAERMLGYAESELVGYPFHDRVHQARHGGSIPAGDCPVEAALAESRPAAGDGEVFVRRDGTALVVSWAVAPVVLAGTRTGAMIAFCDHLSDETPTVRERDRVAAVEAANVRLALLAEASYILDSAADLRHGLGDLARLLVPAIADWVVVDLIDSRTGHPERAAIAHRDPVLEEVGRSRLGLLPAHPGSSANALARILQGEPAMLLEDFPEPDRSSDELDRARLELFRALGAHQAITAPLRTRSRTVGAVTAVRTDATRPFVDDDVALVAELGGRVAYAVENSWLLKRERARAEEMQLALLPELPDAVGGFAVAGRYLPASDTSQVGGDWFDAVALADGSVALIIGDVMGHDLHAATRMGAVRNKLRAIAGDRMAPPAEVLERLDAVLHQFAPDDIATVIYGRLVRRGDSMLFEWSQAGHPPPLLIPRRGNAEFLEGVADVPLGVSGPGRTGESRVMPEGATLVLYTDGLVERAGESIEHGLTRLLEAARLAEAETPDDTCEALLHGQRPLGGDDVAVLAVCLPVGGG